MKQLLKVSTGNGCLLDQGNTPAALKIPYGYSGVTSAVVPKSKFWQLAYRPTGGGKFKTY